MACESPRLEQTSSPLVMLIKHMATVEPAIAASADSYLKLSNRRPSSSASAPFMACAYSPFLSSGRCASRLCRFFVACSETNPEPLHIASQSSPLGSVIGVSQHTVHRILQNMQAYPPSPREIDLVESTPGGPPGKIYLLGPALATISMGSR